MDPACREVAACRVCREMTADSSSSEWQEYDGQVDELASSAGDSRPVVVELAAALPSALELDGEEAVAGVSAAEPQPAASVVLLCDSSDGSDWNDDAIMMTLSDGAREYDAKVKPCSLPCPLWMPAKVAAYMCNVQHRLNQKHPHRFVLSIAAQWRRR